MTRQELPTRHYYDIKLSDHTISERDLEGTAVVNAGRYLIAKTLLEPGAATANPLSVAKRVGDLRAIVRADRGWRGPTAG
jgi:hypothetical protein